MPVSKHAVQSLCFVRHMSTCCCVAHSSPVLPILMCFCHISLNSQRQSAAPPPLRAVPAKVEAPKPKKPSPPPIPPLQPRAPKQPPAPKAMTQKRKEEVCGSCALCFLGCLLTVNSSFVLFVTVWVWGPAAWPTREVVFGWLFVVFALSSVVLVCVLVLVVFVVVVVWWRWWWWWW